MSFTSASVATSFAWSYSQLKNYETCPKRYYHYNVAKDVKEPEGGALKAGQDVHRALEKRVAGEPLPLGMGMYEGMMERLISAPGATYAEQKLALTSSFKPVSFFGKDVWFRTVIDFTKVTPNGNALVIDWKTGKPTEDLTQLQLIAATMFHHEPKIKRVKAALMFVNHNEREVEEFTREDTTEIWSEILPRVRKIMDARASQEYPPNPSGLCKRYCAVTSCPYHGRGG